MQRAGIWSPAQLGDQVMLAGVVDADDGPLDGTSRQKRSGIIDRQLRQLALVRIYVIRRHWTRLAQVVDQNQLQKLRRLAGIMNSLENFIDEVRLILSDSLRLVSDSLRPSNGSFASDVVGDNQKKLNLCEKNLFCRSLLSLSDHEGFPFTKKIISSSQWRVDLVCQVRIFMINKTRVPWRNRSWRREAQALPARLPRPEPPVRGDSVASLQSARTCLELSQRHALWSSGWQPA